MLLLTTSPMHSSSAGEIAVPEEVGQMYRRLSTELTVLVDRVSAIEPDTLMSLMILTCLWVIWTIYVWTKHPFSP